MKKYIIFLFLLIISTNIGFSSEVIHSYHKDLKMIPYPELKAMFTKRKTRWDTGELITVYIKPLNSIEHEEFVYSWLRMTSYRYKRLLEKQTYAGKSTGVIELVSDYEMVAALQAKPYSLGYLSNGNILFSGIDDNHLITIVGHYK